MATQGRKLHPKTRAQVAAAVKQGMPKAAIARRYGLSRKTVSRISQAKAANTAGILTGRAQTIINIRLVVPTKWSLTVDKGPTTDWIARAAAGDEAAFEWIVNQYFEQLVTLARKKLVAIPRQVADDEGAVVSAMRSFFSGIVAGQFPRLTEESELWRVLATITVRKAIAQIRRHWKQSGESDHIDRSAEVREQLDSSLLAPDEIVAFVEQCEQMIDMLKDLNQAKKLTILLIDHNLRMVKMMVKETTVINMGAIIAEGTFQEIIEDEKVRTAYIG